MPSHLLLVASVLVSLLFTSTAAAAQSSFRDSFNVAGTLAESGSMSKSTSPDWWVRSGAYFHRQEGAGSTAKGRLPANDPWREHYASSNPRDTDDGYLPQNLFRFITRTEWKDFAQQVRFRIAATNLTDTPERDGWSGILLFARYLDGDNLYYAGLRHDGAAVIKRKRGGSYTTLAYQKVYPGTYNRTSNPNLLPGAKWIGLRVSTRNEADGSVRILLEVNDPTLGAGWTPVLEASDTASSRITAAGFAGIRTDYMDVDFDDYSVVEYGAHGGEKTFIDLFDEDGAVEEVGSIGTSADTDWWVSSGGRLVCEEGRGKNLHGLLAADDPWRLAYYDSNPLDTENGFRPQNVFRTVARHAREDGESRVWFRLRATNLTDSPSRDAFSGVFLFGRYLDQQNLYVAGLRHDGAAVIKRKRHGSYATLGYKKTYPGTYDRWNSPNLIPQGSWIGMRLVVETAGSAATVRFEVSDPSLGDGWTPLLEAEDSSPEAILEPGFTGLRSDFMDVDLENYAAGPVGSEMPGQPQTTSDDSSGGDGDDSGTDSDTDSDTDTGSEPTPTIDSPTSTTLQGFGATTPGGTGQPPYVVTNLNDSGTGSLRDAVSQGNRMVVFGVSGTITLGSDVRVRGPFVTIDGFSAPSPGITLRGAGIRVIGVNDVVIRGIRIRNPVEDGITIKNGSNNILVEYVSVDGCGDGSIDITQESHDVTVAWSVLSNCAKNMLIKYGARRVTLHHNVFVSSQWRNPWINNRDDGTVASDTTTDMRNNLVWGWGDSGGGTGVECGAKVNVVGNYYSSPGISKKRQENALMVKSVCDGGGSGGLAYTAGNVSADGLSFDVNTLGTRSTAFPAASVVTTDACTAATAALASAGAHPLDTVDRAHLGGISLDGCDGATEEPTVPDLLSDLTSPLREGWLGVFRPSTGEWLFDADHDGTTDVAVRFGMSGDVPLPEFKHELVVFRPSTGTWLFDANADGRADLTVAYGLPTDLPVPADYDADGITDIAVFRPSTGTWFIDRDRDGRTDARMRYGTVGDIPVPADYDGDGFADLAIFRPSTGTWFVDTTFDGRSNLRVRYGTAGDIPVPADYDGDGKVDFAVFRPSTGTWFIDTNRDGITNLRIRYGTKGDVPVPRDYDGNGTADISVFRPSTGTWFVDLDRDGASDIRVRYGMSGDLPLS